MLTFPCARNEEVEHIISWGALFLGFEIEKI
jgi:hypothetical protein